jgi:hypothetical protein
LKKGLQGPCPAESHCAAAWYMTPAAADLGTISVRCRDRFYSALK